MVRLQSVRLHKMNERAHGLIRLTTGNSTPYLEVNWRISALLPGSWPPNWLHGNAKISKPLARVRADSKGMDAIVSFHPFTYFSPYRSRVNGEKWHLWRSRPRALATCTHLERYFAYRSFKPLYCEVKPHCDATFTTRSTDFPRKFDNGTFSPFDWTVTDSSGCGSRIARVMTDLDETSEPFIPTTPAALIPTREVHACWRLAVLSWNLRSGLTFEE